MTRRRLLLPLLLLLPSLATPARAEADVGELAPGIEVSRVVGARAPTAACLRGRFTLLVFYRTGCPLCRREVPLVNRWHADLGARGLAVYAVSYEDVGTVEAFAAREGLAAPRALATIDALRDYGVATLPRAVLVDPAGRVAWRGVPGALDGGRLEGLLAAAPVLPDLPPALGRADDLLDEGRYAEADRALAEAAAGEVPEAVAAAARAARAWIAWFAEAALRGAGADAAAGRAADADRALAFLTEAYAGAPPGTVAAERRDALRRDPRARREIDARGALDEARRRARGLAPAAALDLFRAVAAAWRGTRAGDRARVHVADLEAALRRS